MKRQFQRLVFFLSIVAPLSVCSAALVETTIPPDSEASLYIADGQGDDTGVRILNDSPTSLVATIDTLTDIVQSDGSFLLLDKGLKLTVSGNAEGRMRVRARIRYTDARIREKRLVRSRLALFRLDRERRRWLPAVRLIREKRYSDVRRLRRREKDFVLGHHGYFDNGAGGGYVWAVVDMDGQYAIGNIPEPATMIMLATGGTLLLAKRRRRKVS